MIISVGCAFCGEKFEAHSYKAAYCSDAHRKAASRKRAKEAREAELTSGNPTKAVTTDSPPVVAGSPIYDQARIELEAVGRAATSLGLAALALARQMDMLADSPGALPGALPAQFAAAMARAQGNASGPAATGGLADIIGGKGGLVAFRGGAG